MALVALAALQGHLLGHYIKFKCMRGNQDTTLKKDLYGLIKLVHYLLMKAREEPWHHLLKDVYDGLVAFIRNMVTDCYLVSFELFVSHVSSGLSRAMLHPFGKPLLSSKARASGAVKLW